MANAAAAFDNLIDLDTTVVSASNWLLQAPPTNLVNPHVGKKWRDNATSTFILVETAVPNLIDTVMLAGISTNIEDIDPTFRVRLSTVDTTGAAGDAHDSGSVTGVPYFDANYGMLVYLLSVPVSATYIRVDIAQTGVDYIEAGRMFVGVRQAYETNFQAPWTRTPVRSSVNAVGIGGQTFVDPRRGYWQVAARFEFLTETEREGFVEDIANAVVINGHLDLLWIRDTASNNLSRDAVWGYLANDLTVTQNLYIDPALFGAEFTIRQRL